MLFKGFTSRVGTLTLPQKLHRVVFSAPPPHNVSTRNARKEIKQEVRHVVCLRRLTLLGHTQFLSISVADFSESCPGTVIRRYTCNFHWSIGMLRIIPCCGEGTLFLSGCLAAFRWPTPIRQCWTTRPKKCTRPGVGSARLVIVRCFTLWRAMMNRTMVTEHIWT